VIFIIISMGETRTQKTQYWVMMPELFGRFTEG